MRSLTLLALLLTLIPACQDAPPIPERPEEIPVAPHSYRMPDVGTLRLILPPGTPLYFQEDRTLPLVEIKILFRGGSDWDPVGKAGATALFAELLRSGGTGTRTPREVDEELDFLAADLAINVGRITGAITLSVLNDQLEPALDILFEILKTPRFDDARLKLAKTRMLEGLKARNDSSEKVENREAPALFFGPRALDRLPRGTTLSAVQKKDLQDLAARMLNPKNFLLCVSGAISRDQTIPLLMKHLSDWPTEGPPLAFPEPAYHPSDPGVYLFPFPGAGQGRVVFGHLGLPITHPDVHAVLLMSYVYGSGGFSSRLVDRVRTREGLAYSVRSDFRFTSPYLRAFEVRFQTRAPSTAYAIRLCLDVLKELQEEGPTEKELEAAKEFFVQGFPAFFFSSPEHTLASFARAELLGHPQGYYETFREKLMAVTVEDVHRAANEHFRREHMIFCIVGDPDEILKGDGKHPDRIGDFGKIHRVPLSDPVSLVRPDSAGEEDEK